METKEYTWIDFYTKFANTLLQYKKNRPELVRKLTLIFNDIGKEAPKLSNGEWKDIDPFTVYALFNRGMTEQNRINFIRGLMREFNVDAECPKDFNSIPVVQNLNCAFYRYEGDPESEINDLWEMFEKAVQYADNETDEAKSSFLACYNKIKDNKGLKFKLSIGLYWIRPLCYMGLDDRNKQLIINLGIFKDDGAFLYNRSGIPTAEEYLHLRNALLDAFEKKVVKYHNFPELSLDAYHVFDKQEKSQPKESDNKNTSSNSVQIKNIPLNQILYGPPGTGKTYNTVIRSVAIIEEKDPDDIAKNEAATEEGYEVVRSRFNQYKDKGQISFITFHQSYSYEEFVEGIKPEEPEGDDTGIIYSCQPGIFKDICNRAGIKGNFEDCYNRFIEEISERDKFKLKTPTNKEFAVSVRQNGNLKFYTGKELNKAGSITKEKLRHACAGTWPDYYKGYYQGVINELKSRYGLKQGDDNKQYVLIIDEINRGNISKIFGELITLIEEDKRERLSAQLPYSKVPFTVPKNLSIIGTMNTADRSIAAIDIALRRRFKFVEMMPNSDLVKDVTIEGINLKQLMDDLNRRISVLIDRDHQIGHAYFMHINTLGELKDAWFNKILPLLNEYFYGDWNKLKLLVKTFINEENVPEDLKEEYGDEKLYSFKCETAEMDDEFISDLKGLFTK